MGRWAFSLIAAAGCSLAAAGSGVDVGKMAADYAALREREAGRQAMVLVSFSMPADSLASLAADAARSGVVLVINGLHRRSMRQTGDAIAGIDPQAAAIWQIDPRQFERFDVQAVPLFVVSAAGRDAAVRGDVSLSYALEQISRRWPGSDVGAYADRLRARLELD